MDAMNDCYINYTGFPTHRTEQQLVNNEVLFETVMVFCCILSDYLKNS